MIRVYPKDMVLGTIASDIRIIRAPDGRQVVMSGCEYAMNKHQLDEVVRATLASFDRGEYVTTEQDSE